jgi:hypothetical protein
MNTDSNLGKGYEPRPIRETSLGHERGGGMRFSFLSLDPVKEALLCPLNLSLKVRFHCLPEVRLLAWEI